MKPVKRFKEWNQNLSPGRKLRYVGSSAMLSWAVLWLSDILRAYVVLAENADQLTTAQVQALTVANTGIVLMFTSYLVVAVGIPALGELIEISGNKIFQKEGSEK